jgi:hypothetical protein
VSKIVEVNLKAPYHPQKDISPNEELEIRLEAVLGMAQLIEKGQGHSNAINSVIIDADKALKIVRRKRWWQVWK